MKLSNQLKSIYQESGFFSAALRVVGEGIVFVWCGLLTVLQDQWNVFHGKRPPKVKI